MALYTSGITSLSVFMTSNRGVALYQSVMSAVLIFPGACSGSALRSSSRSRTSLAVSMSKNVRMPVRRRCRSACLRSS